MMFETRKILGDPTIGISVTCARVPVIYCHSESVNVQTRDDAVAGGRARRCWPAPRARRSSTTRPRTATRPPLDAAGRDDVFVGRIRRDPSHPRALNLWVVADNLRKGAATNAVQLAELLHERGLVGARSAAA